MKMCEYVNNFFSLDMLYNQVRLRDAYKNLYRENIFNIDTAKKYIFVGNNWILYNLTHNSISFNLKKDGHKAHETTTEIYKKRKPFKNEELVDSYIKDKVVESYIRKHGIIPVTLEIKAESESIFLIEDFKIPLKNFIGLKFEGDVK